MKKYYHVRIVNDTRRYDADRKSQTTEFGEEIKGLVTHKPLEYDGDTYGLLLRDIKNGADIYMICEMEYIDGEDWLVDIVTRTKFKRLPNASNHPWTYVDHAKETILNETVEISSNQVVAMLKDLTDHEVRRYAYIVQKIKDAGEIAYKKEQANIKRNEEKQKENEKYIDSFFLKKLGKK